jgi:ABC-type sugar transport system ATPase subunit
MGRAIVRQPKAFLMDEPLSNLDAKLRVQMRGDIKKLQTDLGVTTIYVTHDQVEAMTMGDRPRLRGRVELREALGSEVLVHFSTAGRLAATDDLLELAADVGYDRTVERATLVGRFSPKTRVREGDMIDVAVDLDALHVFHPETGAAIARQ